VHDADPRPLPSDRLEPPRQKIRNKDVKDCSDAKDIKNAEKELRLALVLGVLAAIPLTVVAREKSFP
jgi:hypothetical protein